MAWGLGASQAFPQKENFQETPQPFWPSREQTQSSSLALWGRMAGARRNSLNMLFHFVLESKQTPASQMWTGDSERWSDCVGPIASWRVSLGVPWAAALLHLQTL